MDTDMIHKSWCGGADMLHRMVSSHLHSFKLAKMHAWCMDSYGDIYSYITKVKTIFYDYVHEELVLK
jgi:hypothetical protein